MGIVLNRGETKRLSITMVSGPEPHTLASPKVNLTGASVTAETPDNDLPAPAMSIPDPVNGLITALWVPADTSAYEFTGDHTVIINLTYASGDLKKIRVPMTVK